MKGKTATTGLLAMGIVIALATLGLVYGNWTQQLTIGGSVTTSSLNAVFELDSPGAQPDSEDGLTKSVATCTATLGTTSDGTGKNHGLTIDITNAYPNYWCSIAGGIRNTGNMPATVIAKVPTVEVCSPLAAGGCEWQSLDPATIGVKVNELPCGTATKQLMPAVAGSTADFLDCKIIISFPPENKDSSGESLLPEKASFRFNWDINVVQFDKAP